MNADRKHLAIHAQIFISAVILSLMNLPANVLANDAPAVNPLPIQIDRIPSPYPGGYAYRIAYRMPVPLHVCWRFKTDFDNDFLLHNSIIDTHRLLRRTANGAVTETVYKAAPGKRFIWETNTDVRNHRMTFRLINPRSAGQDYHYGIIRMVAVGGHTLIIQQAYFDFAGAGLWVHYPWDGGMRDILKTTVRWEQETVNQLQLAYR